VRRARKLARTGRRQTMSEALLERAREIAYGLERAKDELEDLIP
jgi:hypothetical protein